MEWHIRFGYCVLALLVFRVVWGLVGGHWSRFYTFAYSPARLLRYLRGNAHADDNVGHSPLGALSVFLLLVVPALRLVVLRRMKPNTRREGLGGKRA